MRTSLLLVLLTSALALGLGAAACGSDTGGGGTGGATSTQTTTHTNTGGSSGACGSLVWSSTNGACSACMESSCCDALLACDSGTACGGLVDCLRGCAPGNSTCVTACETANADGQSDFDALIACFDASCKADPSCGTKVCDTGVTVTLETCGACLSAACCDSWKLCAQDDACLDCLVSGAASCDTNVLYLGALDCQTTNCNPKCATRICDTNLGYPGEPACNDCLGRLDVNGGCCEKTQDCNDDPTCLDCITGKTTTGCSENAAYAAFTTCKAKCADDCP